MRRRLEPYKDVELQDLPNEKWESVVGFDGYYQVSNLGRIKSEVRLTKKGYYTKSVIRKLQQMRAKDSTTNCLRISFHIDGVETQKLVSNVVAEAFGLHKNEDKGEVIHHKNLNGLDNRIENLCIIPRHEMLSIFAQEGYMPHLQMNNEVKSAKSFWNNGIKHSDGLTTYICSRCNVEKKPDDFPRSSKHTYCKVCRAKEKGVLDIGRVKRVQELREKGLRKCYKCKEIKNIGTGFHKKSSKCKTCR